MLLPFLILHLIVVVLANPFHKYPYVFLLDVGNEEIEKVNTEQIRLSIPGGSFALKYPATDDGDLIGHIRVSGIDFGTDLKASIVQGGPGYKSVVLIFFGNPGVDYDAVVTIQTIKNIDYTEEEILKMDSNLSMDENTSAEVSDLDNQYVHNEDENMKSMQYSSNIYKYSNEEFDSQNGSDHDDDKKTSDDSVLKETSNEIEDSHQNVALNDDSGTNHIYSLNDNQYGKYEAFRPLIIGGVRFYPQAALYTQDYLNEKPVYDQENHASNDGHESLKDSNNNDSEYRSSVEY